MRSFFLSTATLLLLSFSLMAQSEQPKSPRMTTEASIDGIQVVADYSAPSVRDRAIWDELVPYGKVWRTGANEATTISVDKPIQVNGKTLPAGKYALFTIPSQDTWVVIFNSESNQWGAYKYDSKKDVLKVEVPVQKSEFQEQMLISIEDHALNIAWENVKVSLELSAEKG